MGKKNTAKKHKFKHVESGAGSRAPETLAQGVAAPGTPRTNTLKSQAAGAASVSTRDFSYVGGDLRRIGVMAAALVALELALYYVIVYTPAGAAIYNLVKV